MAKGLYLCKLFPNPSKLLTVLKFCLRKKSSSYDVFKTVRTIHRPFSLSQEPINGLHNLCEQILPALSTKHPCPQEQLQQFDGDEIVSILIRFITVKLLLYTVHIKIHNGHNCCFLDLSI